MNIRKAAIGVVFTGGGVYNIGFTNTEGNEDETQFTAFDINDLNELWTVFCSENRFKPGFVNYVVRI